MKKTLAMFLVLSMVLSLSVTAFASGEPSGEASAEASGEAVSVEEAYLDYIHQFLLAEMEVNTVGMTLTMVENEFMPLVEAGQYDVMPASLLYSGDLDSGTALTFEEFAAQYVPAAAPAAADTSEDAYLAYMRQFLEAEQLVNENLLDEHIEEILECVRTGNTGAFPGDTPFNGNLVSGVAMTYDQFVAAGGIY